MNKASDKSDLCVAPLTSDERRAYEITDQSDWLVRLQPPRRNVCPADGQHEPASATCPVEVCLERSGRHAVFMQLCAKCSGVYWDVEHRPEGEE